MNIRNVLRIYTLERQLNADDIALLNTLRAMNDSEREALVKTLSPQPVRKSSAKKSASKKSSRASSLEQQIQKRAGMSGPLCQARGNFEQHQDHFKPSPGFHEFDPGKRLSAAPTASDSSSANDGAGGGTRNLEDETESAAVAAGGSNE